MSTPAEKVDTGRTMAEMWEGFAGMVMPAVPLESQQYFGMRLAFYSGALCLFNFLTAQMDAGDDVTDADMARMETIDAELRAFSADARARYGRARP